MEILIALLVFLAIMAGAGAARRFSGSRTGKLERLLGAEEERNEDESKKSVKPPLLDRLEKSLLKGGISMPGTQVVGMVAVTTGAFFTLTILLTGNFVSGLVGGLAGVFVLRGIFQRHKHKRLEMFEAQIDTVINLLAGSLRAGASLAQAVTSLADEVGEPARSEFKTIARTVELGLPAAEALESAAERIGSEDLQMIATAALVQRETGGNLAEILDNNAETVRDRRSLRASLKALTTQGRLSGIVIGIIPFVVTGLILVVSPGYFAPMLESFSGKIVMVMSFGAIFVGWFIIRRITSDLAF